MFLKGANTVKKFPLLFLISIFLIILQNSIIWHFDIFGVVPDIVFIYIVCFSLMRNELESLSIAIFTGVIRDAFFPSVFGINTITYVLTAYLVGLVQKRVYKDTIIIPILVNFLSTYIIGGITLVYFYLLSYNIDFTKYLMEIGPIKSIYNSLLSIIIYKFVLKFNKSNILKQDWKF